MPDSGNLPKIPFKFRQVPNLFLCLIIGFLGVLTFKTVYLEILKVEYSANNFLNTKIALLIVLILGILAKRFIIEKYLDFLELGLILLLLIQMFSIRFLSSDLIQVDYIFYTDAFLFFTAVDCFVTGFLIANLKQFRLWFFLIGGCIFISYKFWVPNLELKPENYLMPLLFFILLEIVLDSLYLKPILKNMKRIKKKTFIGNDSFFYIFLSLFIAHLIQYYSIFSNPDSFILGAGLGLLIFNILYHYNIFTSKQKWKYLIGRVLLIFSIILTLHESRFSLFTLLLVFIDSSIISFYRPKTINLPKILISVFLGLIMYSILYFLNDLYLRVEYKFLAIFLFIVISWFFIFLHKNVSIINNLFYFAGCYFFSVFLFSPLPYDSKINFLEEEQIKPIPYLLLPLELSQEKFVFHNTNLPFDNLETLPKKNDFQNKTIFLGIDKRPEIILTYTQFLIKNSLPFILYSTNKNLSLKLDLVKIDYPLFQIYFPKEQYPKEMFESTKFAKWEYDILNSRFKNGNDVKDFSDIFKNLFLYSSGSLYELALEYNLIFFESYKKYAKFYFEKEKYENAIYVSELAFLHKESNAELEEIAFESLKRITPEKNQIQLMEILIKKNKYKEQISKRLYPLYLSLNDKENAISIIDDLMSYYNSIGGEEVKIELKNLKVEKAKIYLLSSNISKAEEIILNEQRKELDSIVWQKLKSDLNTLRENTYRVYLPKETNQTGTEE